MRLFPEPLLARLIGKKRHLAGAGHELMALRHPGLSLR